MNARRWARVVLSLTLATGIIVALINRDQLNLEMLDAAIQRAGLLGPLVFITFYALATIFFVPGSLLTLAGGVLFGPFAGTFYSLTGATLGATFAFLVARYLAADWVTRTAGGWLKQMMEGVENEGWRFVAFTRLVPLFPFVLLNYALGLTRLHVMHYIVATYIFMLPGAFAFTYLGYVGREVAQGSEGMIQRILLALGLLATIIFLPQFIKRLRRSSNLRQNKP